MFLEFRVELDKVDSQAYPEIYPEQAFIFINDAIQELAIEGRRAFEKTTQIADDFRTLLYAAEIEPQLVSEGKFEAELPVNYMYYINSVLHAEYKGTLYTANTKETKHNDETKLMDDPFNQPSYIEMPLLIAGNKLKVSTPKDVELKKLYLNFMALPAQVSKTTNCDLPEHVHKTIVKRAVAIALENLESRRVQTNN